MATAQELKIRLTAQNDASKVVKELNADVARLANTAKNSSSVLVNSNAKMSAGFSGMGRSAGQAGIQIQQLVGQIQGGTNPMLALSQQAADLGFVLGVPLLGAVGGLGASLAMVLLPNLFETARATEDLVDDFKDLKDSIKNATDQEKEFIKEQGIEAIKGLQDELAKIGVELGEAEAKYNEMIEAQRKAEEYVKSHTIAIGDQRSMLGRAKYNVDEAKKSLDEKRTALIKTKNAIIEFNEELSVENDEFEKLRKNLQEQIDTYGMSSSQVKRYEVLTSDLTQAEKDQALALLDTIEYQKQQAELYKRQSNEILTLTDGFNAYKDSIKTVGAEAGKMAQQGMKRLEDNLVDVAMGAKSAKDAFKDMARSIIADIVRIYIRQSLLQNLGFMFGGSPTPATVTNYAGGSSVSTFAAPAPAAPSVMTPLPAFAGGGFTGMGARSGGVDGKGGFPAILHPNESIVDHSMGQSGGVTVVQNINISTGVQQTVRTEVASLMPQIAEAAKGAVLDARKRGGSFAKGFGV